MTEIKKVILFIKQTGKKLTEVKLNFLKTHEIRIRKS